MKVLFCNIGWMKEYKGINEDDTIASITTKSDKNNKDAEQYNFLNLDGYYYGYASTKSGSKKKTELQLEEIDPKEEGTEFLDDVLVIWMAKRPNDKAGSRIIGWYKNARVYRNYKENSLGAYNIRAKVKDSLLIPPMHRSYLIYPARIIGTGKGMGQSSIWLPKGEDAKEIVENCINYINDYSYERFDDHITEDQLNFITKDKLDSIDSYFKKGEELLHINPLKTVQYCNKLIDEKGEDLDILYNKALGLEKLRFYTKARELLKDILAKDNSHKEAKAKFDNINKLLKDIDGAS
ncbi:hypothetical protein [uncultured Clostridium sp.]|uniref:hypothetical protein n=1 Tax=uncultured Clostridium sp. TaxID=59620 RepID=UPI0028E19AE8|nr:hypothetical protein [uncultured Clostridium sp.]